MLLSEDQVQWCLDHGADPVGRTLAKNHDVASMAANWAPLSVVKLLRQYGVDYVKTDALQNAALGTEPGRLEVMAYLIHEAGFPINQLELEFLPDVHRIWACNGLGTSLHRAVEGECQETLKFLLDNGADRNKADTKGLKPIDLARENGFEAGVRLLQQ